MNGETLEQLKEAAGAGGFLTDPADIAPHVEEWRGKYQGRTSLLLQPSSTKAVSDILAICHRTTTPIVPQGGNTGLVGGQIPFEGEILLSLRRLNRIRALDREGRSLTAEAGVVLAQAQRAADDAGLLFPLSLASEGSCTIGGNLSTNAGGVNVLRYGMTRSLVLGLEVVLADGRTLDLLRALRKDNTGYDLKQLFIGAEGTLGVITAATFALHTKPSERATAFIAVPSAEAAITLLARLQSASGDLVSAFELLPRIALDFVLAHIPSTRDPFSAPSPWYVLAEVSASGRYRLDSILEEALAEAVSASLATDAAIAATESQRSDFWRLRESISEAQKREGASIKHDVSVPVSAVPEFLRMGTEAALAIVPGARRVAFGHLGDGNIHFNFSAPVGGDAADFLGKWEAVQDAVHNVVRSMGGSISAEHGIGVMKRTALVASKSPVEIALMRELKRVLDPRNILNPGKIL